MEIYSGQQCRMMSMRCMYWRYKCRITGRGGGGGGGGGRWRRRRRKRSSFRENTYSCTLQQQHQQRRRRWWSATRYLVLIPVRARGTVWGVCARVCVSVCVCVRNGRRAGDGVRTRAKSRGMMPLPAVGGGGGDAALSVIYAINRRQRWNVAHAHPPMTAAPETLSHNIIIIIFLTTAAKTGMATTTTPITIVHPPPPRTKPLFRGRF